MLSVAIPSLYHNYFRALCQLSGADKTGPEYVELYHEKSQANGSSPVNLATKSLAIRRRHGLKDTDWHNKDASFSGS